MLTVHRPRPQEDTKPDLVVEVAHPEVSRQHGVRFLQCCDYMIASTTTFANAETEKMLYTEVSPICCRLPLITWRSRVVWINGARARRFTAQQRTLPWSLIFLTGKMLHTEASPNLAPLAQCRASARLDGEDAPHRSELQSSTTHAAPL